MGLVLAVARASYYRQRPLLGPSASPEAFSPEFMRKSPIPQIPVGQNEGPVYAGLTMPMVPGAFAKGFVNTITGQVNLQNAVLAMGAGAVGALGRVGGAIQRALPAGFALLAGTGATENAREAARAYRAVSDQGKT